MSSSSWLAYAACVNAVAFVLFNWFQAQPAPEDPCAVHAEEILEKLPASGEEVTMRERYLRAVKASILNLVYAESSEGCGFITVATYTGRSTNSS